MQVNHLITSVSCALLLAASHVQAAQLIDGIEGESIYVDVSYRDYNRIQIDGARVKRIKSPDDRWIFGEADADTGQALIQPKRKDPFGIFVISSTGKTYSLVLQPKDIPGESIIIKEFRDDPRADTNNVVDESPDFKAQIKSMMIAMASGVPVSGLKEQKVWQEIPLWQGTLFALERTLTSGNYVGSQYKLINQTGQEMILAEQEFYINGVLAVAIDRLKLGAGESTAIYTVTRNAGVR